MRVLSMHFWHWEGWPSRNAALIGRCEAGENYPESLAGGSWCQHESRNMLRNFDCSKTGACSLRRQEKESPPAAPNAQVAK